MQTWQALLWQLQCKRRPNLRQSVRTECSLCRADRFATHQSKNRSIGGLLFRFSRIQVYHKFNARMGIFYRILGTSAPTEETPRASAEAHCRIREPPA